MFADIIHGVNKVYNGGVIVSIDWLIASLGLKILLLQSESLLIIGFWIDASGDCN